MASEQTTNLSNADSILQTKDYNYLLLAGFTCLIYDYTLTLNTEIKYFWKRPSGIGHLLFFFNRYYIMIGSFATVPITIAFSESVQPHYKICGALRVSQFVFALGAQIAVAALLALRVYALYIANRLVISVMIIAVIALITLSCVSIFYHKATTIIDTHQCTLSSTIVIFPAYAASYAAPLAYDILVFALTASRAWRERRAATGITMSPGSLFSVLIRDSSFYFMIMVFVRITNVVTMALGVFGPSLDGIAGFMTSLSVILTSHFMVNLRSKMAEASEGYEITVQPPREPSVIDISRANIT